MKRAIFLATVALLAVLIPAPVALAQEETTRAGVVDTKAGPVDLPPSGGPAILLPAAALLLGSGVLAYATLRRR